MLNIYYYCIIPYFNDDYDTVYRTRCFRAAIFSLFFHSIDIIYLYNIDIVLFLYDYLLRYNLLLHFVFVSTYAIAANTWRMVMNDVWRVTASHCLPSQYVNVLFVFTLLYRYLPNDNYVLCVHMYNSDS